MFIELSVDYTILRYSIVQGLGNHFLIHIQDFVEI